MGGRADVIARPNALETELGASVWSGDFKQATRIVDQLQSSVAWVNSHFDVAPNVRLGGHKQSGIGVEWGLAGLLGYCNSQTQWLKKGF